MTDRLTDQLALLAERAPVPPLDVEALGACARRRQRTRAARLAAPLLAFVVAVPVALAALGSTDTLTQPAAPAAPLPLDRLQADVDVEVVTSDGAAPTLAARAIDEAQSLGDSQVDVRLELTAVAGREVSFLPLVELSESVQVDGGTALLGVSGFCDRPGSCRAALVLSVAVPGPPATAVLRLQPRSGDRQTAPGTYRVEVPLDDGQLLRIVVGVTEVPPPGTPTAPPPAPGTTGVQVFFSDPAAEVSSCDGTRSVVRQVPQTEAVATAALQQLFAGPTPEEAASGVGGFGPETAGLLRSVRIVAGTAYVDLDASLLPAIANYSTSCGMVAFEAMVGRTLTQFPTVTDYVVALDGDPVAWVEFMQGGCPADPPQSPDPCDPAPFR